MPIGLGDGPRDIDIDSCFFISALFASAGSGAAYAWNGFRNAFDFSGFGLMLGVRSGIGLEDLLVGRKLSSRTSTKLEGNNPIDRLSLHSLPIHHDPSPALRHSIRSPSTNPRSRLDYFNQHIENFGVPNAITYFATKTVHRADPTRKSGGYIPWGCHVEIRRKDTVLCAPRGLLSTS